MTGTDRRSALRLILAAALAPMIGSRPATAQAITGSLIAPPPGFMTYRRIVERDLVDGNRLRVQRDFAVSFERFDGGFMLQGRQTAVSADAHPSLENLIRLERARDEGVIFPLALDPFGRIVSASQPGRWEHDMRRAFDETLAMLSRQPIAQSERETLRQFVSAFHAAGHRVSAHLPVDLFAPSGAPRREEQRIALPGGGEGRVVTTFDGELDAATGLMREATREIVTEADGSSRFSRENWSLEQS